MVLVNRNIFFQAKDRTLWKQIPKWKPASEISDASQFLPCEKKKKQCIKIMCLPEKMPLNKSVRRKATLQLSIYQSFYIFCCLFSSRFILLGIWRQSGNTKHRRHSLFKFNVIGITGTWTDAFHVGTSDTCKGFRPSVSSFSSQSGRKITRVVTFWVAFRAAGSEAAMLLPNIY